MAMEFDQYLQPCDVVDSRYLTSVIDPAVSRPPRLDLRLAAQSAGSAASSKDRAAPPASPQDSAAADGGAGSSKENRCTWECNFDYDDVETILTSETVSSWADLGK